MTRDYGPESIPELRVAYADTLARAERAERERDLALWNLAIFIAPIERLIGAPRIESREVGEWLTDSKEGGAGG